MENRTLSSLGVSIVVLMALGGFVGATAVEKILARKASES